MNWKTEVYSAFVNLDHRTDRLESMLVQLNKVSLTVERMPGMLPNHPLCQDSKFNLMRSRTPGAIGCYLSQCAVMTKALELGRHALVFEDDCVFCLDFIDRLDYIGGWMSTHEWDVFYLGSAMHLTDPMAPFWHPKSSSKMKPDVSANIGFDAKKTDDPRVIQTFGAFDTFAYIVNIKSIEKVLKMLDDFVSQSIGIDHNMLYWQPRGMNSFAFLPGLVRQKTNQSDIGNGITHWDNFLKLGEFVFKDYMHEYDPEHLTICNH